MSRNTGTFTANTIVVALQTVKGIKACTAAANVICYTASDSGTSGGGNTG